MASRALGAMLAFAAAILFVASLASPALTTGLPAWWDGHPVVDGKERVIQELHIGPFGAKGCNEHGCSTIDGISSSFQGVGYAEGGVIALAALFGFVLTLAAWRATDRRKAIAAVALVVAILCSLGALVLIGIGPEIKSSQHVDVPIGMGLFMVGGGIILLAIASVLTLVAKPEPLRLKPSRSPPSAFIAPAAAAPPGEARRNVRERRDMLQPSQVDIKKSGAQPLRDAALHVRLAIEPGVNVDLETQVRATPSATPPPPEDPPAPPPLQRPTPMPEEAAAPPAPPPPADPPRSKPAPTDPPRAKQPRISPPTDPPRAKQPSVPPNPKPTTDPPRAKAPTNAPSAKPRTSAPSIPPPPGPPLRGRGPTVPPPARSSPTLPPPPGRKSQESIKRTTIAVAVAPPPDPSPSRANAPPIEEAEVTGVDEAPLKGPVTSVEVDAAGKAAAKAAEQKRHQDQAVRVAAEEEARRQAADAARIAEAKRREASEDSLATVARRPSDDSLATVARRPSDDSLATVARRPSDDSLATVARRPSDDSLATVARRPSEDSLATVARRPSEDSLATIARPYTDTNPEAKIAEPEADPEPDGFDNDRTLFAKDEGTDQNAAVRAATATPSEPTPIATPAAEPPLPVPAGLVAPLPIGLARAATPIPRTTAPQSLPPPRITDVVTTGPTPACPQCEQPISWVEEHLRFYCKSCRMYF